MISCVPWQAGGLTWAQIKPISFIHVRLVASFDLQPSSCIPLPLLQRKVPLPPILPHVFRSLPPLRDALYSAIAQQSTATTRSDTRFLFSVNGSRGSIASRGSGKSSLSWDLRMRAPKRIVDEYEYEQSCGSTCHGMLNRPDDFETDGARTFERNCGMLT